MAREYEDSVQDVATSTGTGAFVMAGTPPQTMRPFSVHTVGATFEYKAFAGAQWEIGDGAWDGTSIARSPRESSNGGALVNFTTAPTVWEVVTAATIKRMPIICDIAFAQSIPLTTRGESNMPIQRIATTGPLTFSPAANAVRGAYCLVTIVGDGTTALTVSGFAEDSGSIGFANVANMPYDFVFWYTGYEYRYTVQQALSPSAILAAPTAVTLSLSAASTVVGSPVTVTVRTNGTLTGSQTESVTLTAPVAGTWSANPITLNATTSTATPIFTPSATGSGNITAAATGTPTLTGASVAYAATATPVQSISVNNPGTQTVGTPFPVTGTYANGTPTALDYRLSDDTAGVWTQVAAATISGGNFSFSLTPASASAARTVSVRDRTTLVSGTSGTYVVNASAAAPASLRYTNLASLTESGTDPNYTYTGTGTAFNGPTQGGLLNQSLQAGIDGWLSEKITAINGSEVLFYVTPSAALQTYLQAPYALWGSSSGYKVFTSGSNPTPTTAGVVVAVGDIMRMRRTGSNGAANTASVIAEVSKDNGTTWTPIYTWTGVSTGALHFQSSVGGGTTPFGSLSNLAASGLA